MVDDYGQQAGQFFSDVNTRIRDLEERHRILKDRMVLISESFVKEREKGFEEMQEMKRIVLLLKEENLRLKEVVKNIVEKINTSAQQEELLILQRQFDMFREK